MKLLELEVDDSIFNKFKDFLAILPDDKIKVREIYNDAHIPYVSDDEQREIEESYGEPSKEVARALSIEE